MQTFMTSRESMRKKEKMRERKRDSTLKRQESTEMWHTLRRTKTGKRKQEHKEPKPNLKITDFLFL